MTVSYERFKKQTERKIEMIKEMINAHGETLNLNLDVIKGMESSLRLAKKLDEVSQ